MIECLREKDYDKIPIVYALGFDDVPWSKDWYDIPLYNKETVWVYKDEGEIVGFIISFLLKEKPYISVLTVVPQKQRLGVASQLLQNCLCYWKQSHEDIYIHVEKKRLSAKRLYEKFGFYVMEEDEMDYYMRKDLNDG